MYEEGSLSVITSKPHQLFNAPEVCDYLQKWECDANDNAHPFRSHNYSEEMEI